MHLASRAARIAIANRVNSRANGDEVPYIAYITDIAAISKLPNLSRAQLARKSRFVWRSAELAPGPASPLAAPPLIPPCFPQPHPLSTAKPVP